jgi:Ca-activated chloride channel homolog
MTGGTLPLALLLHPVLLILAFRLVSAGSELRAQETPVYRAETDLVYLTVAVTDRAGRPVDGLDASDIRVYEDGIEQEVYHFNQEKVPLTVGLVLDRSGSMHMMIDEVYEAALHVIENLGDADRAFALTFSNDLSLVQPVTSDMKAVRRSLRHLRARGATALYDAVYEALEYMARIPHREGDRKVLTVVTDGDDNVSRRTFGELLEKAMEGDVIIHSVAMGEGSGGGLLGLLPWFSRGDEKRLRRLAETTGGTAHRPRDMKECERVMKRISEELKTQYGLGYYPSNRARDGNWRKVRVVLEDEGREYAVRTRQGYYAPAGVLQPIDP